MKLNKKEIKILSMVIAVWGIFLIGSGVIVGNNDKTITKVNYKLNVSTQRISEAQAKKNEIIVKNIEVEIDNPISVNIKDYLVDADNISTTMLKKMKLDTSLVNTSQAGTYKYTITYKKKKFQGTVKVKEKELPDINFTLKEISLYVGDAISTDVRTYIKETISDEVYNNIILDLSQVDNSKQNSYKYFITYKNTKYEGTINVRERVILPSATVHSCPSDAKYDETEKKCKCNDENKTYDEESKTCKTKTES